MIISGKYLTKQGEYVRLRWLIIIIPKQVDPNVRVVGLSVTHEDGRSDIEAGNGDNGGDGDEGDEDDEEETVRNRGKDREKNQKTRASGENSVKSDKIESQASQEKMIKCESFAEKLPTCYRSSLRQARFVKREKFGGNVEVF